MLIIFLFLYCSDEGERYDSDGDVPPPKHTGMRGGGREYRDNESLDSPERHGGNGIKAPLPLRTTSKTSTPRSIKKVDLGAAASFAKEVVVSVSDAPLIIQTCSCEIIPSINT